MYQLIIIIQVLATQSCPTPWQSMDSSPPGSSVHGDCPGKNTGVSCHFLIQAIFLTQGSNQCLLNCRQILYCSATGESILYIFHCYWSNSIANTQTQTSFLTLSSSNILHGFDSLIFSWLSLQDLLLPYLSDLSLFLNMYFYVIISQICYLEHLSLFFSPLV